MAIRTIREEGDEILRKKSKEVEKVDDKMRTLIADMIETMHQHNGVGLSAVQVGVLKRVVVIDTGEPGELFVFINPVIMKTKGEQTVEEGCLSFPNKFGKMIRPAEVTVKALDEYGNEFQLTAEGLLAQAICHEVDHLNGELFIDKIIPGTLEIINPEDQQVGGK